MAVKFQFIEICTKRNVETRRVSYATRAKMYQSNDDWSENRGAKMGGRLEGALPEKTFKFGLFS